MKYLVLSDIHGSSHYLEEVLKKETFDKLLLLGDILPHGPRNDLPLGYNPKKVIELLKPFANKIICVRGNCDAEVDDMVLPFPINDLASICDYNTMIYMTHGHKFNKDVHLNITEGVVLYGHFHVNEVTHIDKCIYINVGSLSIPKDHEHSYGIIEHGVYIAKNLKGEILLEVNING